MFQKRLQFFGSILYLGDLCLVALCWVASYLIRFWLPLVPITKGVPALSLYLQLLPLILVVFAVVLQMGGLYRRPWATFRQYMWPLLRAATFGTLVAISVTYFLRPYEFSRLVFLQFYFLLVVSAALCRPLMRWLWIKISRERGGQEVLIVGIEELGRLMAAKIREHPELGLRVVGFLTRRPEMVGKAVDGLKVLGRYDQAAGMIAQYDVQVVLIALPLDAHERIGEILDDLAEEVVDIKIAPDFFRYTPLRGSVEEFEGLPIIGLRGSPLHGWNSVAKRAFDLAGASTALILLGPLMLLIALAVRLSSPGSILYRQKRMGLDGQVFDMLKFRSMHLGAEECTGPVWAADNDPRCTTVGAIIRRTSLDELPQLFNVLRGEMSLVGPRPERPELIADFKGKIPHYMLRHRIKAGMTGWAQVNGWRGNTSLQRRIEHDLYYIENWSLALDCKIMALTVVRGFIHPHAY